MALVSPGLQITVTDESQYVPGAVGTVPLVVLATTQNKATPGGGGIAIGTTKEYAGALQSFTSQRELISAFGNPQFAQTSAGTPINAHERSEYGLMAAYSALGVGNKLYAIRADIDLAQLAGTSIRPIGSVPNGTYWFDLATTAWGINEWNASTQNFETRTPTIITVSDQVDRIGSILQPDNSIGAIGSYAVVARSPNQVIPQRPLPDENTNFVWYKNTANEWVLVGSLEWQKSWPAVLGTNASPTITAVAGVAFSINGQGITLTTGTTTVAGVVADINNANITGITAGVVGNKLAIYVTDAATNGRAIIVSSGTTTLSELGITAGTYAAPKLTADTYVNIPAWRTTDATPRPTGSVFVKTTALGKGANFVFKKYALASDSWQPVTATMYANEFDALYALDPAGGGNGLQAGTMYVKYTTGSSGVNFKPYYRATQGMTKVTGKVPTTNFVVGHQFSIEISQPNSDVSTTYTLTLTGTSKLDLVRTVLAADIPNLLLTVEASGALTFTHKTGGTIVLRNLNGTPVTTAGFDSDTPGVSMVGTAVYISNWRPLPYLYGFSAPYQAPEDGRLWYYNSFTDVDIMVNSGNGWKGYRTVSNDARGYNLTQTDPAGPILSPIQPLYQSTNEEVVPGDLWIDTSEAGLQNFPKIHRFTGSNWELIDNTDKVSQNGIYFADARWDADVDATTGDSIGGMADPVAGEFPPIENMLLSNYVDLDAPDYRLYPRGVLLFNTRRSGGNVKRYVSNHFSDNAFPNATLPDVSATWVTASGKKENGAPFSGALAVRNMVVKAMRAALDTNTEVREERYQFNLIACPGYPELIPNMINLNNDRANTAFIIGDAPMTLEPSATKLTRWSTNADGEGLANNDAYLGIFYPAARTNDLAGNPIVVPASHMMLRTFIRNDNVSYQWFAPAGTRRGLIDNANNVGYVNPVTGAFVFNSINQGLRDTLYTLNMNPVTQLPGVGLVSWGQKTRNPMASAMDRINVARLVNYIRTILSGVGNGFLFEPNDKQTRDQLKQIIEGAMNDLVAKRGITDYLVVCDESNNTSERIARNELYVDIAIEPMRSVEFIYIPIRLKNPGGIKSGGK